MALSKEKARLVERLRNPRFRPREGQFIVEGVRGVREVLRGKLTPEVRFALVSPRLDRVGEGGDLKSLLAASGFPVEELSDRELEALSDTEHPQGVLMVVKEPRDPLGVLAAHSAPRVLLLDGVQDPGNTGTLIRAARAFGLNGVFALEGTVDPFNPKVVRASAGALAHIPVLRLPWADVGRWLGEKKVPLLVADAGGEDVRSVGLLPPWALVIGNEGAGPRIEIMESAARVLAIPMDAGVDSLNAGLAGAILLFALSPSSGEKTEN
jgi:TrmH family RNA methyltransferase